MHAADSSCIIAPSRITVFLKVAFASSTFIEVNSFPSECKPEPLFTHMAALNPGCRIRDDTMLAVLLSSHTAGYSLSLSQPLMVLFTISTLQPAAFMAFPSPV